MASKLKKKIIKKKPSASKTSDDKNAVQKTQKKKLVGIDPTRPVGDRNPPREFTFKKGQSGNPAGSNKAHKLRRAFKSLTEERLREAIELVMDASPERCQEILDDPDTPLFIRAIITAGVDAANNGKFDKLNLILERVVGRPVVRVDHTTNGQPIQAGAAISINDVSPTVLKAIAAKADDDV